MSTQRYAAAPPAAAPNLEQRVIAELRVATHHGRIALAGLRATPGVSSQLLSHLERSIQSLDQAADLLAAA